MDEPGTNKKNLNSNLNAALSYVWVLSVVMYVTNREDPFVRFHAKQGIVLFGISVIGMMLTSVVFLLGPIFSFVIVIFEVIGFFKALSGERYKLPIIGSLIPKDNSSK